MNWKAIERAWESGDCAIAVRLLSSMVEEMRFEQRTLSGFFEEGKEREKAPDAGHR